MVLVNTTSRLASSRHSLSFGTCCIASGMPSSKRKSMRFFPLASISALSDKVADVRIAWLRGPMHGYIKFAIELACSPRQHPAKCQRLAARCLEHRRIVQLLCSTSNQRPCAHGHVYVLIGHSRLLTSMAMLTKRSKRQQVTIKSPDNPDAVLGPTQ